MEADVGTVQEVVTLARRAGLIPEDWVDGERAPEPVVPLEFANAEEATLADNRSQVRVRSLAERGQERSVRRRIRRAG